MVDMKQQQCTQKQSNGKIFKKIKKATKQLEKQAKKERTKNPLPIGIYDER